MLARLVWLPARLICLPARLACLDFLRVYMLSFAAYLWLSLDMSSRNCLARSLLFAAFVWWRSFELNARSTQRKHWKSYRRNGSRTCCWCTCRTCCDDQAIMWQQPLPGSLEWVHRSVWPVVRRCKGVQWDIAPHRTPSGALSVRHVAAPQS